MTVQNIENLEERIETTTIVTWHRSPSTICSAAAPHAPKTTRAAVQTATLASQLEVRVPKERNGTYAKTP